MKVSKKMKVLPASLVNPPSLHLPRKIRSPKFRSAVGRVLESIVRDLEYVKTPSDLPESTLGRIVSEIAKAKPVHVPALITSDQKVYDHYTAYCRSVGVEPRSIEHWHSLRDKQRPTGANVASAHTTCVASPVDATLPDAS